MRTIKHINEKLLFFVILIIIVVGLSINANAQNPIILGNGVPYAANEKTWTWTQAIPGGWVLSPPQEAIDRNFNTLSDVIGTTGIRIAGIATLLDPVSGDNKDAELARIDAQVLACAKKNLTVLFLLEYYWKADGTDALCKFPVETLDWFKLGQTIATRYQPGSSWLQSQGINNWGITLYEAFNEPDGPCYGDFIDKAKYRDAIKNFADGVHSVNKSLKAMPGAIEVQYGKAVADLFDDGTFDGIDTHSYVRLMDYGPGPCKGSAQTQYEWIVENAGLKSRPDYYPSESNYWIPDSKPEGGICLETQVITQEEAGKRALTEYWSVLGVVDSNGKPITKMSLTWNLLSTDTEDWILSMCTNMNPWTGNPRGKVFQMMTYLTKGMSLISSDPKKTGDIVCTGNQKKLWVFQNRPSMGWTNHGGTSFTCTDIPIGSTKIEVYRYDSWTQTPGGKGSPSPYRTINLSGETSLMVNDLPTEETLMFLATNSNTTDIDQPNTSINEINQVTLFPNPTNNSFKIEGVTTLFSYQLYNSRGRLVFKKGNHNSEDEINVAALSPGIYLIKIMAGKNIYNKKIIVKEK